jgi:SOS-response transcriptional repressor LexA
MHRSTTEIVYEFICEYKDREGVAPSLREIAKGCFLSPSTAQYHLMRLEAWGWLTVLPGKARGIVLLERKASRAKPQAEPGQLSSKKRSPQE